MGPGAGDMTWIAPLRKFIARAADCRSLGGGTCIAINAINTYAYSVLGFTCQLKEPTAEVIRTCKHFNRTVLGGPYRWMPDELYLFPRSTWALGHNLSTSRCFRSRPNLE